MAHRSRWAGSRLLRVVGAIGLGVAAILVVAGVVVTVVAVRHSSWPTVQGQVVSVYSRPRVDTKERPTYRPTVRYEVAGKTYTVDSNFSSTTEVRVGDDYPVRYDPADPGHASFGPVWFPPLVVDGVAVVSAIVFGTVLLIGVRTRRKGAGH